jgi:histidine triad (HIT) family protein
MDTLFLKIISGEIPSAKVYEDEATFAFLDIRPIHKGHILVIPKKHCRNTFDMDEDTQSALIHTSAHVARALKEAVNADGINIIMNNEGAAGQEVFHAHFHIIPRFTGDNVFTPPKHAHYTEGEMETLATTIATHLV